MSVSKIGICNIALAHLGAGAIRSFDENNKRARMSEVFFASVRDYLLSKFDWPFARKFKWLQPLNLPEAEQVPNFFAYQLPNDCRTPRDIHPPGSKDPWEVMGNRLFCKIDPSSGEVAGLYYTVQEVDTTKYSDTFITLLALLLAIRIAPSITQDKELTKTLFAQYDREYRDAWESDANIGNLYREFDEDPNNDTFVSPDGYIATSIFGTD